MTNARYPRQSSPRAWRNWASLGSVPRSGSRRSSASRGIAIAKTPSDSASSRPSELSDAGSSGSSPSATIASRSAIGAVHQVAPTLSGGVRWGLQVGDRLGDEARDVHLGDPEALADLGLRQLVAEPQRQDHLLAFRERVQ